LSSVRDYFQYSNIRMSLAKIKPPKPIKFYCSIVCPWAARTWIALVQANVEFEYIEINLKDKPDWFLRDVNPGGKVPTLKYGDDILIESAITTEFVADLIPEAKLHIADPYVRAESRLMADRFVEYVFPVYRAATYEGKFEALEGLSEAIRKFLPYLKNATPFFGGSDHLSTPEILIAPFISRLYMLLESDAVSAKYFTTLTTDPQLKYFNTWAQNIISSPGVKGTFEKTSNMANLLDRVKK